MPKHNSKFDKPSNARYKQNDVKNANKIRRTMKNQNLETPQEAVQLMQVNRERSLRAKALVSN